MSVAVSWESPHISECHHVKKSIGLTDVGLTQGSTASMTCCQHFENGSAQSYPCPYCHHDDNQILTVPPNIIKQEHLDLYGAIMPAHELQPSPCLTLRACAALNLSAEFLLLMFLGTDTTPNCTKSSKLSLKMHHSALLSLSKGCDRNSVLHCSIHAVDILPAYKVTAI